MKSYTLRVVLRKDKANTKGLCPISVCHTTGGKRTYITTGLRVKKDQWSGEKVKGHPHAVLYNLNIQKQLHEIEARILKGEAVRQKEDHGDFLAYATKTLQEIPMKSSTRARWSYYLEDVKEYAPTLTWEEITPVYLHNLNKHLLTDGKQQSTAVGVFKMLRRVFNEARRDGTTTLYPFGKEAFKLPAVKEKPKTYHTLDELDKLEKLLRDGEQSKATRSTIAHYLLECYAGIRHSDWSKWQTERLVEDDKFKLTTTKTDAYIYIPLKNSPRLKAIVELIRSEGLEYTYSLQDANRKLKAVAKMVGIDKHLTSHVGRHTCAILLLELGFSKEDVAEVLGISLRVVSVYAKMTRQKVKAAYEKHGGL